jgi:hypothetical protein
VPVRSSAARVTLLLDPGALSGLAVGRRVALVSGTNGQDQTSQWSMDRALSAVYPVRRRPAEQTRSGLHCTRGHHLPELIGTDPARHEPNNAASSGSALSADQIPLTSRARHRPGSTHRDPAWWRSKTSTVAKVP